MAEPPNPELITISEAARRYNVSRGVIHLAIKKRELNPIRTPSFSLLRASDVQAFFRDRAAR